MNEPLSYLNYDGTPKYALSLSGIIMVAALGAIPLVLSQIKPTTTSLLLGIVGLGGIGYIISRAVVMWMAAIDEWQLREAPAKAEGQLAHLRALIEFEKLSKKHPELAKKCLERKKKR